MFSQSLLVLVTLATLVFGEDQQVQDQETAEQFYQIHGYYPTWYNAPVYRAGYYYNNYAYRYRTLPYFYHPYPYGFQYVL